MASQSSRCGLLRELSAKVLWAGALAVLLLHPLLDVSALPVALRASCTSRFEPEHFARCYPVIPWIAIVVLGFVVGRDAVAAIGPRASGPHWRPAVWCCSCNQTFGHYGNAYPYASVASLASGCSPNIRPILPFSAGIRVHFSSLAVLTTIRAQDAPVLLRPFEVFGRVPFFSSRALLCAGGERSDTASPIWIARNLRDLAVVAARHGLPCVWYYRIKRTRPNLVTRYF